MADLEEIVLTTLSIELEMDKALLFEHKDENIGAIVPIKQWRNIASLLAHIRDVTQEVDHG